MIKKLEDEFKDINFLSIDIDQVPQLAKKFEIRSIPTLLLIKDGEEFNKIVGTHQLKSLRLSFTELMETLPWSDEKSDDLDVAL